MKEAFAWIVLAILAYLLLQTDAPTPANHWEPYATGRETGKLEWVWAGPYETRSECEFNAEKATNEPSWTMPAGCLYFGYQNPYIQWLVNSYVALGYWKCIARITKRDKFADPVYEPILRDGNSEGDGWKCYLNK